MKYEAILFDLDGTLTDPGEGITNSVMYALKKFNIEAEREELYKFIGPPLIESFMKFYGFSETDAWKCVCYYREYFGVKGIFENKVYDDIPTLLTNLKKMGFRLLVATSKPTEYSIRILERFDLAKYFEFVSGSPMDSKNSTKAMIIKTALEHANIEPDKALMVGDRLHDVIGAKENTMECVGVTYGYGSLSELQEVGADYIAHTVMDILEFVR